MPKIKPPSDNDWLSVDDVAELLFVTDRTIRNWLKDKNMPSVIDERGRRFRWSEVLPWYVRLKAEEGGNDGKKTAPAVKETSWDDIQRPAKSQETFDDALCRKTIAEADLKELELATKRAQVVAVEVAAVAMQNAAKNLQVEILGWPTLMIGQIFGQRDRNRLFDLLSRSARDLCGRLASVSLTPPPEEGKPADG